MEKWLSCKKMVKSQVLKSPYDTMPWHAAFPPWYYKTIIQVNKHWVYYTHCMCLKPEIAKEKNDNKSKRTEMMFKSLDEEVEIHVNRQQTIFKIVLQV